MVNLLITLYSPTSGEKLKPFFIIILFFILFFSNIITQFAGREVFTALPLTFFLSLVSHRKYLVFHHIHLLKKEVKKTQTLNQGFKKIISPLVQSSLIVCVIKADQVPLTKWYF